MFSWIKKVLDLKSYIFRHAIEKLMEVNPLSDHVDMKDHYLAFIDLDKFGIEDDMQDKR